MIGKLTGVLDAIAADWLLIDVGGVGYRVSCSARTLRALPRPGEPCRLLIETHVREDAIQLFGFMEPGEQEWFRVLQTVQGVGSRVALGILSVLGPAELVQAIASGDRAELARASGVGPKLATRIVSELKDRTGGIVLGTGGTGQPEAAPSGSAADAVSALVNLGYRRAEAHSAVARANRELGAGAAVESLIRHGLKELGR